MKGRTKRILTRERDARRLKELWEHTQVRTEELRAPLSEAEIKTTRELVRGSKVIEVPGAYNLEIPDRVREPMILPEPRLLSDYTNAPCKHECSIIKQLRHAKHAHRLMAALNPVEQTLLRAKTGQCGLDLAQCHSATVKEVVKLDRTGGTEGGSQEAALLRRYIAPFRIASGLCQNEIRDHP